MTSTLNRGITNEIGLSVKYTPCEKSDQTDDELEEISIINPSKNENQSSPSHNNGKSRRNKVEEEDRGDVGSETNITINGPRHLPGSCTPSSPNDRTKLIGERLSSSERISLSSPVYSGKVIEQKSVRSRTTSRQSIFELVRVKNRKPSRQDQYSLMRKVISNETVASKEVRKQRRKEIEENFFKKSNKPDIYDPADRDGCNWTFVFDPSGRLAYWWASVVSVAFLYNFWVIIYRFAFQEIHSSNIALWFTLDYMADLLYILDIVFHFRTGYLEDGVLQTDTIKLRIHYMNTTRFYIDCLCLLPLDFLYLSIGYCSILRCFRLVKVYRFWTFLDRTERHTNYPNAMRTLTLMHYLLALFHWNACLYYIVGTKLTKTGSWEYEQMDDEMRNDDRVIGTWQFPADKSDVIRQYLHALYWSTLTLTTIGGLPRPRTNGEYVFVIWELLFGLLLFATVLGHISNIVSSISAARKDFQAKLDGVKTYMSLRRVPLRLQDRVIRWFDYLWICNKSTDEEKTLSLLPDKLKAEIAIHVHLDTLKRVEIFQATEAGFLCELVLRLKPVLFSPGDYICTKGEVGKEMYIVNRGRLHVVSDNGKTVLATLKPGSYFGEISILNMGTSGNRRTASVRSVGYSDLFRLSKQDLWDVLKEYPAARVRLEAIAVKRLEKTKKSPIEKASLCRSRSTPGLVESRGKVPLESMVVSRNNTLPTGLPTQSSSKMNSDPNIHTGSYTKISDDHVTEHQEIAQDVAQHGMTETQTSMTIATNVDPVGSIQMQPSLVGTDRGQRPIFQFSPPLTPRPANSIPTVSCVSGSSQPLFSDSGSHEYMTYSSTAQVSPMHVQYPSYSQQYPCFNSQMPFLSPFPAHSAFIPPTSPNFNVSRSNNFTASHSSITTSPMGSVRGYSSQQPINVHLPHIMSSMSPVSMYADTPQDVLTQEITRLRERLATLESENTSLHTKLNQQQWEVEHRLSELEMHICQSDMGSSVSTDDRTDRFETLNRESII